jgi:hypothetical protein
MVVRTCLKVFAGFLAALVILGLILGVAGYFAVRNLDIRMLRPELERQLTRQTGFRVELGDTRLEWCPAPQLLVEGIKFYHPKSLEKILQSDQIRIGIDLTAIWRKHFGASQVLIKNPVIFLKRDRRGVWNWQTGDKPAVSAVAGAPLLSQHGFIPMAEAAEEPGGLSMKNPGGIAQGWEFGIGKILVRNATVHFTDETIEPAFKLDVDHLEAEARQKVYASSFHFDASGTVFNSVKKNLDAEGDLDLASRELDLTLRYGPEKVMFKGSLKAINALPLFEGTIEIRDLDMEPLIPTVYRRGDYISGLLSTQAQIAFDSANPAIIKRSLKGQGTTGIKNGALRNRNVIKEVFDRLSPVLAITNALGGELPPELNEMLKDRDTPFESLQVAYAVEAGVVKIREFRLAHPNYQLSGKGVYGILDQRVDGSVELLLSRPISAYMIQKIRELGMIADRNGQVMIPFRYSGIFPNAAVQPDLSYVAAQMLQGGTDQLLNKGIGKLSKILGAKKASQDSSTTSAAGTDQTTQPVSKKKKKNQWLEQGLDMLTQIQEPQKQ